MSTGYILGDECLLNKLSENQKNNRFWTIVYIRRGIGLYLLDGSFRCLNEGDIIILPPWVRYSFASDDLGDEYNINIDTTILRFDENWLNALLSVFPVTSDMVLRIKEIRQPFVVTGTAWIRMSSLMDDLVSCKRQLQPMKILSLLELLSEEGNRSAILEVCRHDMQSIADRKEKIVRFISCNYNDKITLEQVADYVGFSRTYFSVFFKNQFREGFSDYVNKVRVEKSKKLLLASDMPIASIANECGFKTVQYYTRAFKKLEGKTPGTFRRSERK